ncbi:MAG TPA: type IV pilus secretin PilQ [Nevskiales bacterium]|nr:type IV pilus secretin PilQ [Nevskiales bacterium]
MNIHTFKHLGLACGLAVLALGICGQAAAADRSLDNIEYQALPGQGVLLTLTLSEAAPDPVVFTVDQPARLALDLPDTRVALANRYNQINLGSTRAVAAAEAKDRSRVVVELTELVPYSVRVDGNKIYVQIGGAADSLATAPAADSDDTEVSARPPARLQAADSITKVDFRRGEKGQAQVVVGLSNPGTPVDIRQEGGLIIAEFRGTQLPSELRKRLDVLDFATPAKFIDVTSSGNTARIAITPVSGADFEQSAYQAGNVFTIELQPLSAEELAQKREQEPRYTGPRIGLNFQKQDVRTILQILADALGFNLVMDDSIKGDLAMRLDNVPADQALDIILRTKELGKIQEGNVMLIEPLAKINKRREEALKAAKSQETLAPLTSEIVQINFAKADEIATLLKSKDTGLLSDRGRISVDPRTNTLLIQETRDRLAEIRKLIAQLDIAVRQVLIESRIVVANKDFSRDLGARFGVSHQTIRGDTAVGIGGNLGGAGAVRAGGPAAGAGALNVSLPVVGGGSLGVSILSGDYLVEAELSALQSENRGEIISTPRVITANGKEATIEQGVEIPYLESSSSGATTVSFKKAVLSLKATPQITPDGHILMDLDITNDTRGEDVGTGFGGSIPSIDTRQISTQVLVNNGETVVLGGVFTEENSDTVTKVPVLADIPLVGALFRQKLKVADKSELLIFVTPKILKEGLRVDAR